MERKFRVGNASTLHARVPCSKLCPETGFYETRFLVVSSVSPGNAWTVSQIRVR